MSKYIDYVIKYKKKNNPTIKAYNQSIADLLDKKVMLEGLRQKGYLTEEFHHGGCDVERCPVCGMQLISCDCELSFAKLEEVKPPEPELSI